MLGIFVGNKKNIYVIILKGKMYLCIYKIIFNGEVIYVKISYGLIVI